LREFQPISDESSISLKKESPIGKYFENQKDFCFQKSFGRAIKNKTLILET